MKMLTPDELRSFGSMPGNVGIPLTAEAGPMLADALEIADDVAAQTIENNLTLHVTDGGVVKWWDLDSWEGDDTEPLDQAVRYLEARGTLERHRTKAQWVQTRVVS